MNPEIKARWVAALRSDKYEQGTGRLRNFDNEFCCLGVLCDLYNSKMWGIEDSTYCFVECSTILPDEVAAWADIIDSEMDICGERGTLAWHNDSGRTFAEIADAIEDQL